MKTIRTVAASAVALACMAVGPATAWADDDNHGGSSSCSSLPGQGALQTALKKAVADESSGLDFQMWATIVDRDGIVCAVAFSGSDRGAQWPGSRVISAQKANTANSFSLSKPNPSTVFADGLALSTANLYAAVQPGGSLFGLQESNPVDTGVAYKGPSSNFGKANDPMVGEKIGGVNVFGGGLGLYAAGGKIVGGLGVSGDTSCADHNIGWRVRNYLGLDHLKGVGGVSGDADRPDNIILMAVPTGFGHPHCVNDVPVNTLPPVQP